MATFLQLCQRVHRYARIGEDAPGSAPVTVNGQRGVLAEIVGWVQDASDDIQADQDDWRFREGSAIVLVPSGARTVDVSSSSATDYDTWRPYTGDLCRRHILAHYNSQGSADQQPVWFVEWDQWRGGMYERGSAGDTTGKPTHFTVRPDGLLRLYPTADAPVVLTLAYRKAVQPLLADNDVPILPVRHHDAIVWRALMYYADTRDKTQEPYAKWERRRKQAMQRLYRDQLPEISF